MTTAQEWLENKLKKYLNDDETREIIKQYDDFLKDSSQEETESSESQLADHPMVKKLVDWLLADDDSTKLQKILTAFENKLENEKEENNLMSAEYPDLKVEYDKRNDDCEKQLQAVIELKEKIA